MRRKISILMIFIILLCCGLLVGCTSANLISKGPSEDYKLYAIQDLTSLSTYVYREEDSNYWDFYSVEYDLNVPVIEYELKTIGIIKKGTWSTYTLTKVETEHVKGVMAHSDGIYYLRENAFGSTLEILFDTVYEVTAFKISGVIEELYALFSDEDDYEVNQWICFDYSGGSEYIVDALRIINHFYDKEILNFFEAHADEIEGKNNIYQCSDIGIAAEDLHDWFKIMSTTNTIWKKYSGFCWEVTDCDLTLDLSKANKPRLKFSMEAYYEGVDTTIECGGTLQYNNINNTVLEVPAEVQEAWKSYEGYARKF